MAASRGPREPLDEGAFKHFAPLLKVSQDYASYSGCRFRCGSFDGLPKAAPSGNSPPSLGQARSEDSGPRLAAKIKAAPTVADFAQRLRSGEEGLKEEVDRAFRIVMVESVRNAMQGMFQAMDMYPPLSPPSGVDDEDCAYEDTSAALPVMAQRLYNDEVRRKSDTTGGPGRLDKRAMTAAFITDFAEGVGVDLPEIPATQRDMLNELSVRVSEETQRHGRSEAETSRVRDVFLRGLGAGAAAESLRLEAKKWWAQNWKFVAMGAAITAVTGLAVAGLAGLAVAALGAKSQQRVSRDRDGRGEF